MVLEILTRTPLYVWGIMALLIFLGIRRLEPRRTSLRLAAGAASARFRTVPRPEPLPGSVFVFAATAVPLIVYMAFFLAKYALQVWSALVPFAAWTAALIGFALTAIVTGRTAADFCAMLNVRRP